MIIFKPDYLALGIGLLTKIAQVVVSIAPLSHIRVRHLDFAPQGIIGNSSDIAFGVGDFSQIILGVVLVVSGVGLGAVVFLDLGNPGP